MIQRPGHLCGTPVLRLLWYVVTHFAFIIKLQLLIADLDIAHGHIGINFAALDSH